MITYKRLRNHNTFFDDYTVYASSSCLAIPTLLAKNLHALAIIEEEANPSITKQAMAEIAQLVLKEDIPVAF